MLSPEAYSPWKPYNAGCRVYIAISSLDARLHYLPQRATKKCTHLYHRQLKSSFFVPLSLLPLGCKSPLNHIYRMELKGRLLAYPTLTSGIFAVTAAVTEALSFSTIIPLLTTIAPHIRICLHWKTQTFKVKRRKLTQISQTPMTTLYL